jgi:hypothetical protein
MKPSKTNYVPEGNDPRGSIRPVKSHKVRITHIDYLYFNIYNYFHRVSQDRQNFNARMQAMYFFSLGSGGWLLLLEAIYLHVIMHSRFVSRVESTVFSASIYLLTAVFFNYIFIVKDRDQKIFGKYEGTASQHPRRKIHFVVSITVLLIPYVALLLFAVLSPRYGR